MTKKNHIRSQNLASLQNIYLSLTRVSRVKLDKMNFRTFRTVQKTTRSFPSRALCAKVDMGKTGQEEPPNLATVQKSTPSSPSPENQFLLKTVIIKLSIVYSWYISLASSRRKRQIIIHCVRKGFFRYNPFDIRFLDALFRYLNIRFRFTI